MSRPVERQVDQLVARVRDLERELAAVRGDREQARRGFAELALAAAEPGDTIPAALGAVSSGAQSIASGQATILEVVNSGGLKLKPIQNSAGANKAKLTYLNATGTIPQVWSAAAEPMLLARLRDGRWVRVAVGGDVHFDYLLVTGWSGGIALARRRTMDMTDLGQIVIVRDPRGIFSYQKAGDGGIMFYQPSLDKYYAVQANCKSTPVLPTDPLGACCYQSGSGWDCFDATSADCAEFGGTWKGAGTSCAVEGCP